MGWRRQPLPPQVSNDPEIARDRLLSPQMSTPPAHTSKGLRWAPPLPPPPRCLSLSRQPRLPSHPVSSVDLALIHAVVPLSHPNPNPMGMSTLAGCQWAPRILYHVASFVYFKTLERFLEALAIRPLAHFPGEHGVTRAYAQFGKRHGIILR